jgi:hypothetical protein
MTNVAYIIYYGESLKFVTCLKIEGKFYDKGTALLHFGDPLPSVSRPANRLQIQK